MRTRHDIAVEIAESISTGRFYNEGGRLSQRQLAANAGLSSGAISHYESANRVPSRAAAAKIGAALDIYPGRLGHLALLAELVPTADSDGFVPGFGHCGDGRALLDEDEIRCAECDAVLVTEDGERLA